MGQEREETDSSPTTKLNFKILQADIDEFRNLCIWNESVLDETKKIEYAHLKPKLYIKIGIRKYWDKVFDIKVQWRLNL